MNNPNPPEVIDSLALGPPLFSEAAKAVFAASGDPSPAAFRQLMEKGLHLDACRWMASQFPLRHAIWWGLLCIEDVGSKPRLSAEIPGMILRWVIDPTDMHRDQIHALNWEHPPESPIDYLAKAIAWSGPTMSAPHLPQVKADPRLCGILVAAAIEIAAASHASIKPEEAIARFIQLGLLVDSGKIDWSQSAYSAGKSATDQTRPQGLFP
ncbi:MAG: DUF6931 family protein [Isosphaeraceae bacterium]